MVTMENKLNPSLSVGIVGCGWLGTALATTLLKKGFSVQATSSKLENVAKLNAKGINTEQLTLPATSEQLREQKVFQQKFLVIAITPQLRQGRTDYAAKIESLVEAAKQQGIVQRIILLSSTAVYDGLTGLVDEQNTVNLAVEKVKILHQAEQAVMKFAKQANVIRLSGLLGPERHPGKFLLANKTLVNSTARVNLIHQQDAVGLIIALLQEHYFAGIFNGVSDTHVTKQEYYQAAAAALAMDFPDKTLAKPDENSKVVSGEKAKQVLNYKFIYPDLLTWL